jgi:hypothetical protein
MVRWFAPPRKLVLRKFLLVLKVVHCVWNMSSIRLLTSTLTLVDIVCEGLADMFDDAGLAKVHHVRWCSKHDAKWVVT